MADKDFRVKNGIHVGTDAFIQGDITSVDRISMNTSSATEVVSAGQLAWNPDNNTIDIGMNANTTLQVGQEEFYYVNNETGTNIAKGIVVMANGTNGASGSIRVTPAIANGSFPSKYLLGVTAEAIPNGGAGFVTGFGKVRGLNTNAFSQGDILYANPAVAGGLSNTAPIAPNNIITVAIVINKHPSVGTIFVRPTYASSLYEDETVFVQDLRNNQVLTYVSANTRFENKTVSTNSNTANALSTARLINGTSFNGTADITTANWGTARTIWGQSINGSANVTTPLLPAAGSVSAPAFSTSGDTNTGIYFPAADTIAFTEGGSEAMRITATSNVGIGTTTPAQRLDVTGVIQSSAVSPGLYLNKTDNATDEKTWRMTAGGSIFAIQTLSDDGSVARFALEISRVGTSVGDIRFINGTNQERMRIDSAGNVGIGTTTAATRLDVNGDVTITDKIIHSGDTNTAIRFPANDTVTVETSGNERLRVTSAGLVGIGTTSPLAELHVNSGAANLVGLFESTDAGAILTLIDDATTGGSAAQHGLNDTNTAIRFPAADTVTVETNGAERMRITSTGNVGIGTNSPILPLDIRGRLVVSDGSPVDEGAAYTLQLQRPGSNVLKMSAGATDDNFLVLGTSSDALTTGLQVNNSDGGLRFRTGNAERMRVTSSGNVGIGTTTAASRLDVNGDVTITDKIIHSGDTNTAIRFPAADTVTIETDGAERMRITSTGLVGIGTNAPQKTLHIAAAQPEILLQETDQATDESRWRVFLSGSDMSVGTTNDAVSGGQTAYSIVRGDGIAVSAHTWSTANSERMRIDSTGNVGIGTSSPTVPLHIVRSGATSAEIAITNTTGNSNLLLSAANTGLNTIFFGDTDNFQSGFVQYAHTTDSLISRSAGDIRWQTGGTTERMRIDSTGNVGIGTTTAATKLDVNGEVTAVDYNTTSDISVKENIYKIDDALNKVQQLNGVTFNFINDDTKTRHAGVIAQDVEKVLPEAVKKLDGGIKHVAYGNLIGLLVEAIKEQQKQIEQLHLLVNK